MLSAKAKRLLLPHETDWIPFETNRPCEIKDIGLAREALEFSSRSGAAPQILHVAYHFTQGSLYGWTEQVKYQKRIFKACEDLGMTIVPDLQKDKLWSISGFNYQDQKFYEMYCPRDRKKVKGKKGAKPEIILSEVFDNAR